MSIIEARGLARDFTSRKRTVHAVRGVDLTVEEGEIVVMGVAPDKTLAVYGRLKL